MKEQTREAFLHLASYSFGTLTTTLQTAKPFEEYKMLCRIDRVEWRARRREVKR